MTGIPHPRFRVRFRDDVGFEMQCLHCDSYWPISLEFWSPSASLRLCRVCVLSLRRRNRIRRSSHTKQRRWSLANRERINAQRRARRASWPEERRQADRVRAQAWREAHREELRIYNRLWRADRRRLAA